MIKEVWIENFRCFRALSVELKPLNVLIGPNDTGKSSFLAAIRTVASGDKNRDFVENRPYFKTQDNAYSKLSALNVDGWKSIVSAPLGSRRNSDHDEDYPNVLANPIAYFQLPVQGVPMESVGVSDKGGAPPLGEDGSGLPGLLDFVYRRDRDRFFKVVEVMRGLIPGLKDVIIGIPEPNLRRLELVVEDNVIINAERASAGVRLLMFFVALAYHPSPPQLVLLEEPETGVHPRRLAEVTRLLREISQGRHGGAAAQVILTTHSPYLLDLIDLDADQVLIFRRNEDGVRTAVPADHDRLKTFLDEFMLGEVWYNQGEEGLVARRS